MATDITRAFLDAAGGGAALSVCNIAAAYFEVHFGPRIAANRCRQCELRRGRCAPPSALVKIPNVAALDVGELLHTEDYSLFDSLTVLELMDPKMDPGALPAPRLQLTRARHGVQCQGQRCGVACRGRRGAAHHALRAASHPLQRGLPVDHLGSAFLIGVLDDMLAMLGQWLRGSNVCQTLFASLYLLDVPRLRDPVLKVRVCRRRAALTATGIQRLLAQVRCRCPRCGAQMLAMCPADVTVAPRRLCGLAWPRRRTSTRSHSASRSATT